MRESSPFFTGFVLLHEVLPEAIYEIRYASTYNFVGEKIDGYGSPVAILTAAAAGALKRVASAVKEKGFRLKIYDAYRPERAVRHFFRWAEDETDDKMKPFFYPEIDKKDVFRRGFIAKKSAHSRGSTVDLTLFDEAAGKDADMGGTFDYFGERSYPDFDDLTDMEKANRRFLAETMKKEGFVRSDKEWWHFTLSNEPYPDTYFDFVPETTFK